VLYYLVIQQLVFIKNGIEILDIWNTCGKIYTLVMRTMLKVSESAHIWRVRWQYVGQGWQTEDVGWC
jgi:hypothetical protein